MNFSWSAIRRRTQALVPGKIAKLKRSDIIGWSVIGAVVFIFAEIFFFVGLSVVGRLDRFTYSPPKIDPHALAAYAERRHPELGWPTTEWLAQNADNRGARLSPANAVFGDAAPCVSVYGDSFAFSDEATPERAWANVLATDIECRVDNYGVGGYGVDQALLRFESHLEEGRPLGDLVILTLYPDNLNRNVNQWRYLLTGGSVFSFKPAFFVNDAGEVALSPLPPADEAYIGKLTKNPGAYLAGETYFPNASGFNRPHWFSFPFSRTVAAIFLDQLSTFRFVDTGGYSNFQNRPSYFDSRDGPSAYKKKIASYIIDRFSNRCRENELRCAMLLIPSPELVFQRGKNCDHDLSAWLPATGPELIYLDATKVFENVRDICTHVTNPKNCSGHFSTEGYKRLALFVKKKTSLDEE